MNNLTVTEPERKQNREPKPKHALGSSTGNGGFSCRTQAKNS